MHPAVYQAFEEILTARKISGSVLEIGATPDESTLLTLPALAGAREKIGVNLAGASRFRDFSILPMNANDLSEFPAGRFDVVLCNAMLEHDRFFWKTLAEIRRVIRPGGLVAIGTPGYRELAGERRLRRLLAKLSRFSKKPAGWAWQYSTLTLGVHNFPGDYYRFSEQAFREVFLEGLTEITIRSILIPPRIIGTGICCQAGEPGSASERRAT